MKRYELFILSLGVFLTVIAWLLGDIYHAASEEKIKKKVSVPAIKEFQIDEKVLDSLIEKQE